MRIKKMLLAFFLLLGCIDFAIAQREVINTNRNWKFRFAHEYTGRSTREVQLPHTWNTVDALSGKVDYKRCIGNYTKDITYKSNWENKRVFVRFKGAFSVTDVFLNGKHIGNHQGGYGAFIFELTDKLLKDKKNELLVRVNNSENLDIMPLLGDFNFYGGIYRDVDLIVTDNLCISPLDYASPGIYLEQTLVNDKEAKVNLHAVLSNNLSKDESAELKVEIFDNDKIVETKTRNVVVPANNNLYKETIQFSITKPHLWNSTADPFMYKAVVSLIKDGKCIDSVAQPLGLRYFEVDSDKGFILNGKHLALHGVCRHQDRAEVGNALQKMHHEEDVALMLEMGVNAARLAHYPQDTYFYDLMDKSGIVTWAEIPFVGPGGYMDKGYVDSHAFRANGKEQLKELIRQHYNHPSICFWGMFNELNEYGDNPVEYIKELNHLALNEDRTRPTTAASNLGGDINFITDLMAWNRYDGWYGSTPKTLATWLDDTHKQHPSLKIAISEYGAGASIYHQQDTLVQTNPQAWWHPENWQTYYHIENWKIIKERPFVWGSFVWNMFDFGAAHRTEGDRAGINDKGLVTFDRKIRKDAFFFYKANWNDKEPMIHIAEKRNNKRTHNETEVMVFTNQPEVTLYVNGKKVGTEKADDVSICKFKVLLDKGENKITAKCGKVSDDCIWMY